MAELPPETLRLVGRLLRQQRDQAGLSLKETAKTLAVTCPLLKDVERGRRPLSELLTAAVAGLKKRDDIRLRMLNQRAERREEKRQRYRTDPVYRAQQQERAAKRKNRINREKGVPLRTCGFCNEMGHYKPRCPKLEQQQPKPVKERGRRGQGVLEEL